MKNNWPGFSHIEIMVVLLIISIIAIIAVPLLFNLVPDSSLQSAAQTLASDMRFVQQKAISTGVAGWVRFYQSGNYRLSLPQGDNGYTFRQVSLPVGISAYTNFPTDLYFYPTGAPSKGGTVVLHNKYGKKLYVIMTPATGRIRVSREPPDWDDLSGLD